MSRDGDSNFLFFLFGTAIGAAAGLLLAPKSGKETREDIKDWLNDRRERGGELLEKVKERLPEAREQLASARERLESTKEQIAAAVKAGKQAFQEAKHTHA